jgi:putative transposase
MYRWRHMTDEEREKALAFRKQMDRPWHGPPHRSGWQTTQYHISAAGYEHEPIIGTTPERMDEFAHEMLKTLSEAAAIVHVWCILPNHYHALVTVSELRDLMAHLGKLHGRTSFAWNKQDVARGRHCWHRASDRAMRGERHFWASVNYIHHNPVRHGYVNKWQEWPWSSVHAYMAEVGREEVEVKWKEYPVLKYGDGWDDPAL